MERLKAIFRKIFFLPPLPTVLIAVPSLTFVFVMLSIGNHSTLAYIAYILSAYAMIITVTGLPGIIESIRSGIDNLTLLKKSAARLGAPFAWGCCFSFTNFPLRQPVYQSSVCCGESVFRHSVSFRMVYCPCLLLCPVICYACGVGPVCPS